MFISAAGHPQQCDLTDCLPGLLHVHLQQEDAYFLARKKGTSFPADRNKSLPVL